MAGPQQGGLPSDLKDLQDRTSPRGPYSPWTIADVANAYGVPRLPPLLQGNGLTESEELLQVNDRPPPPPAQPRQAQPQAMPPAPRLGEIVPPTQLSPELQAPPGALPPGNYGQSSPSSPVLGQHYVWGQNPHKERAVTMFDKIEQINTQANDADGSRAAQAAKSYATSLIDSGADPDAAISAAAKFYSEQTQQGRQFRVGMENAHRPVSGGATSAAKAFDAQESNANTQIVSKTVEFTEKEMQRSGIDMFRQALDKSRYAAKAYNDWLARGAPESEMQNVAGILRSVYTKLNAPSGAVSDQENRWITDKNLLDEFHGAVGYLSGGSGMSKQMFMRIGNNINGMKDAIESELARRTQATYESGKNYAYAMDPFRLGAGRNAVGVIGTILKGRTPGFVPPDEDMVEQNQGTVTARVQRKMGTAPASSTQSPGAKSPEAEVKPASPRGILDRAKRAFGQ